MITLSLFLGLALAQGPLTPPALAKPKPAAPRSLEAAPQPLDPRVEAARRRLVSGDPKGAAEDLKAVLSTSPDAPDAHYWLGIAFLEMGRTEDARAALSEALSLKRGIHPDALYHLGLIAMQTGNTADAISMLEAAITQAQTSFPAAENALGAAYVTARDYDRAVEVLDRIVTARPDDATAQHLLGLAREQRFLRGGDVGDIDRAAEAHRRAVDVRPDYGIAHRDLALVLLWNGRVAEAASHLDRFTTLQPSHPAAATFRDLARRLREGLSQPPPADSASSAPRPASGPALERGAVVYSPRISGASRPASFGAGAVADGVILPDGSFVLLGGPEQGAGGPALEEALAASRFEPGRVAGRPTALRVLVSMGQ
jgi:tetratricopeptide (TPR) repeat protein